MNLEGLVSKRADAPYRSVRGEHCIKVKCWKWARFAMVGFVPEGSAGLLKLRLARRGRSRLIYVGRVGHPMESRDRADRLNRSRATRHRWRSPLKKADTTLAEPRFDAEMRSRTTASCGILPVMCCNQLAFPGCCRNFLEAHLLSESSSPQPPSR
jgi:bifunctional non-homologous end joining protein LigD